MPRDLPTPRFPFRSSARIAVLCFASLVVGPVLQTSIAWAQPAPAAVTPPKLVSDPGVVYPRAALESGFFEKVSVSLLLEIDKTGAVKSVTLKSQPPLPAFEATATAAAERLVFEPALRGGIPVAARISFRYDFAPPPARLSGRLLDAQGGAIAGARVLVRSADGREQRVQTSEDGRFELPDVPRGLTHLVTEAEGRTEQSTDVELRPGKETQVIFRLEAAEAPAPAPGAPPKIEVVVRGEKLAPAVTSFTREEVRQLPGAFGDPFRSIEALPGVTPIVSGLPFFYVRGAPPGNVGYFLDGVRVPYLFHVAIGPSVVQPAMVERVDLYPGGYPARFGRYAGGIVAAETTDPQNVWHGEGNIRVFDAGAMVEGGFADGRGTVLVGGRYSYTAKIISLLSPDITLDYRDFQTRVSYDLTPRDRVSAFTFGSYDLLSRTQNGLETILFGTEFYRADVRYDHSYRGGNIRTAVSLGLDQTRLNEGRNARTKSVGIRTHVEQELRPGTRLRAGFDTVLDAYEADKAPYGDPEDPATVRFDNLFPPRQDIAMGTWGDLVLNVTPEIEVTPGLRVDVYGSGGASAVGIDPRIAARFSVSDKVRIIHAYGIAHQPPAFVVPIPGLTPGNLQGGLQTSFQTSAGVEVDVTEGTTASATLFQNAFFEMSDALGTTNNRRALLSDPRSIGSAYGFELFIKRRLTKKLGGYLSYTLSRSMRSLGNEHFPSAFDRTHVASGALAYDLGRRWRAGTRLVYYTGTPKTSSTGGLIAPARSSTPERNPSFYRIDLRLEKRWQLAKTAWISFVAEMMNATLNKETFANQEIGPVAIPSVGVEGGF